VTNDIIGKAFKRNIRMVFGHPLVELSEPKTLAGAFLTRDAQKITPSRREPCSSRTFLEVVVNLGEIRTERNSLRDNGVDFASVSRNHERLITGNVARNNYEMHRPRAVRVDSVGAALVLKSGRAPCTPFMRITSSWTKLPEPSNVMIPIPSCNPAGGFWRVFP
jgi:hypothetical protein